MQQPSIRLHRNDRLAPGQVRIPEGRPGERVVLSLGSARAEGVQVEPAPAGELHLAEDLWETLVVPFDSLLVEMRSAGAGEIELGPAVGVLYPGEERLSWREAEERAAVYYGDRASDPGLFALGFDQAIDWQGGRMAGYVLDNRPGRHGEVLRSWFPIPTAIRLTWAIRRDVILRLRELTQNRTFNWVRSIGKGEFHRLISADEGLRPYLPETRMLRTAPDLAALLVRHGVVFVKLVHGLQGYGSVRVRWTGEELELIHMHHGEQVERTCGSLEELMPALRAITGPGRRVVQQGIPITGLQGRALHFRLVTVRRPEGGWRLVVGTACVAGDARSIFTNLAHGAEDQDLEESLQIHCGVGPEEARRTAGEMEALCLRASAILEETFAPLGLLGFDLLVEAGSPRIWLLEANAVPGWGYPTAIEEDLARSQVELALALTGFRSG